MKINQRVPRFVFPVILLLSSCTVHEFERHTAIQEQIPSSESELQKTLVFVYFDEKDQVESTKDTWHIYGAYLQGITLGLFPIPLDLTWAPAPPLPSSSDSEIAYTYDARFSERLSQALGDDRPPKPTSSRIADLLEQTRKAGYRYLYLVAYNEFDSLSFDLVASSQAILMREYTGSIPVISRVLWDTRTGSILLNKQRIAETYFLLVFTNGWDQGLNHGNSQYQRIEEYIQKVAAGTEDASTRRAIKYLIEHDFQGSGSGY